MQKGLCLELAANSYHSYGCMKEGNRSFSKSLSLGFKSKWPLELTVGFKNKSNEDCWLLTSCLELSLSFGH